jgi:hypothetical protein
VSAYTKIPMARLGPLIDEYLKDSKTKLTHLAKESGVPERRIYAIRRGFDRYRRNGKDEIHTNVEFTTADKLLTAMGRQEEWYKALLDLYEAPEDSVVPPAEEVPE